MKTRTDRPGNYSWKLCVLSSEVQKREMCLGQPASMSLRTTNESPGKELNSSVKCEDALFIMLYHGEVRVLINQIAK
jgi:hypothetical protein